MTRKSAIRSFCLALGALMLSCGRTATEPVPEWLFQTYSDRQVGTYEDVTVTRYTFHEDNRATAETISNCGSSLVEYEFTWEELGEGELALYPADGSPTIPESGTISYWVVRYTDECEPLELEGVLKADGQRTSRGELSVGAVCVAAVPPPDGWAGGEWKQCEAVWCEGVASACE